MEKYLITGFSGFVGQRFLRYLGEKQEEYEILGVDMKEPAFDYQAFGSKLRVHFLKKNLLDQNLYEIMVGFQPDYILHLASYSSVAYSWKNPVESFLNNTNIFLNVVSAIRSCGMKTRILSVGSSEEYGNVSEEDVPIKENCMMEPNSPYAVARFSQEHLSRIFAESYGLNIIMTRSFNHIGKGQDARFAIPGFIRRILEIKNAGKSHGVIETGDLSIIRDFTNVDDVVKAYDLLLHNGRVGEVYNVCSGKGIVLRDVLQKIAELCGVSIQTKVNSDFVRPNDSRIMIGSYEKINQELGWVPEISLEETLKEMIYSINEEMKNES